MAANLTPAAMRYLLLVLCFTFVGQHAAAQTAGQSTERTVYWDVYHRSEDPGSIMRCAQRRLRGTYNLVRDDIDFGHFLVNVELLTVVDIHVLKLVTIVPHRINGTIHFEYVDSTVGTSSADTDGRDYLCEQAADHIDFTVQATVPDLVARGVIKE